MQATMFTVQPFEGGPETSFYEVPPARMRAAVAFKGDEDYEQLDQASKNYLIGTAFAILSAKARGLSGSLDLPRKLTVKSVEDFATRYFVLADDSEIPHGSGDSDEVEENPTATPQGLS